MDVRIILKWISRNEMECVDLAQHRDKWGAVWNALVNLRVPLNVGLREQLRKDSEGLKKDYAPLT
jgi:hypothetical protein